MNPLYLHCGAHPVAANELGRYRPPAQPLGPNHFLQPYDEYVDLVKEVVGQANYEIDYEAYGIQREGAQFFGLMQLRNLLETPLAIAVRRESLMLGLRGSYDQSLSRGLALGARVFVCDNLSFSGEVEMHTKQTTHLNARLPALVNRAVESVAELAGSQALRFDIYRDTPCSNKDASWALVELHRRKVLGSHQLARAIKEWYRPSHEQHAEDGHTLWTLHNAVTEAIKPYRRNKNGNLPAAVLPAMTRTLPLRQVLDKVSGISFE